MIGYVLQSMRRSRGRLLLSVGGVALAIALMLALDAVLAGTETQITAYVDHSEADIWVSQTGVRTMHMSASALPLSIVDKVEGVLGVERVTPILYVSSVIGVGQERAGSYVIGLPADAASGIPWDVDGAAIPPAGGAGRHRADARAILRTGAAVGAGHEHRSGDDHEHRGLYDRSGGDGPDCLHGRSVAAT
jgi:putative ABC transport system permease protein